MLGYATDFHYRLGGMLHAVHHSNGVTETIDHSPSNLQRPHRISTTGVFGGNNWDSGTYLYDSSGNVKQIGTQTYTYDRMSRLTEGKVDVEGVLKTQSLSYDAFGNILSLTTGGTAPDTSVSDATNRLDDGTYDAGGNLTNITVEGESYQYTYDPLNMMKHLQSTTDQARIFLYDADDERILTFDCVGGCATQEAQITATIRGLDNKVLRTYQLVFGEDWQWQSDNVFRDGLLLAAVEPKTGGGEETVHYHLDHLGTPRQITSETGAEVAFHSYYPFGEEATDPSQDERLLKFTGHERDENGSSGAGMLDYMHARYCSPGLGRFVSVDPLLGETSAPQSWNRYTYVRDNPLRFTDPTGQRFVTIFIDDNGTVHIMFETESRPDENLRDATLLTLALINPLPGDEVAAAVLIGPKIASRLASFLSKSGRIRRVLGRLFGKADDVSKDGEAVAQAIKDPAKGLRKQLEAHKRRLEELKRNPGAHDNKNFLKNAPSTEVRDKIVRGRINNLERQIESFKKQIRDTVKSDTPK